MVAPLSRGLFLSADRFAGAFSLPHPYVCQAPIDKQRPGSHLGERLGLVGGEDETVTRGGFRCRGLFSLGHGMELR